MLVFSAIDFFPEVAIGLDVTRIRSVRRDPRENRTISTVQKDLKPEKWAL